MVSQNLSVRNRIKSEISFTSTEYNSSISYGNLDNNAGYIFLQSSAHVFVYVLNLKENYRLIRPKTIFKILTSAQCVENG